MIQTENVQSFQYIFYILYIMFFNKGFSFQNILQIFEIHSQTQKHTYIHATMYMLSPSEPSLMTSSPGLKLNTDKRSTIMAVCSSSRRLRKSFFWMALTIRFVSLMMGGEKGHLNLRSLKSSAALTQHASAIIHY